MWTRHRRPVAVICLQRACWSCALELIPADLPKNASAWSFYRQLSSGTGAADSGFTAAYVINVQGRRATSPVVLGLLELMSARLKRVGFFQVFRSAPQLVRLPISLIPHCVELCKYCPFYTVICLLGPVCEG